MAPRTALLIAGGGVLWEILRSVTPGNGFDSLLGNETNASSAPGESSEKTGWEPPGASMSNASFDSEIPPTPWWRFDAHATRIILSSRVWLTQVGGAFFRTWRPPALQMTWTWEDTPILVFEFLVTWLGWALFGDSWHQVRSGFARCIRVVAFMLAVFAAHYLLAVAWPAMALTVTVVKALVGLTRTLVRMCGYCTFRASRWTGAVPEATGVNWQGPASTLQAGAPTLTAAFQKFKSEATQADGLGLVLRRGDAVAWVKPLATQTAIRSPGLTLSISSDLTRSADNSLKTALVGNSEVHLCRNMACEVEPDLQHFKMYAAVAAEDMAGMEAFQLRQSVDESMHNLSSMGVTCRSTWNWLQSCVGSKPKPLPSPPKGVVPPDSADLQSESEAEEQLRTPCQGAGVLWVADGCTTHLFSASPAGKRKTCPQLASVTQQTLQEDRPAATMVELCGTCAVRYVSLRGALRCSKDGCNHVAHQGTPGNLDCGRHGRRGTRSQSRDREEAEEPRENAVPSSSRRRSRSRASSPHGVATAVAVEAAPDACLCGTVLLPNAAFCLQCGKKRQPVSSDLPLPLEVVSKSEKSCLQCGWEYPELALFCLGCGTKRPTGTSTRLRSRSRTPSPPEPEAVPVPRDQEELTVVKGMLQNLTDELRSQQKAPTDTLDEVLPKARAPTPPKGRPRSASAGPAVRFERNSLREARNSSTARSESPSTFFGQEEVANTALELYLHEMQQFGVSGRSGDEMTDMDGHVRALLAQKLDVESNQLLQTLLSEAQEARQVHQRPGLRPYEDLWQRRLLAPQGTARERRPRSTSPFRGPQGRSTRSSPSGDTSGSRVSSPWSLVSATPAGQFSFPQHQPDGQLMSDRRAGAAPREGPGTLEDICLDLARSNESTQAFLKHMDERENVSHPEGTFAGLGHKHHLKLYLLRMCGLFDVVVGPGEYGRDLVEYLRNSQATGNQALRQRGFRLKVDDHNAIGVAGAFWGAFDTATVDTSPGKHWLIYSDFREFSDDELDDFTALRRVGPFKRQPEATDGLQWFARVKTSIHIFALINGREWGDPMLKAATYLYEEHKRDPWKWPLPFVRNAWEELMWTCSRHFEELVRQLKRQMGDERPTFKQVKAFAMMPNADGIPWLHENMPTCFDVHSPDAYFKTVIAPRIQRQQDRLVWSWTHGHGQPKWSRPKVPAGGEVSPRAGGGQAPNGNSLIGHKLNPKEIERARKHGPKDQDGLTLCWGHLTHGGCSAGATCQRSHKNLKGKFEELDYSVQLQFLRRAGLKIWPALTDQQARSRMEKLRKTAADDTAAKVADGNKQLRGKASAAASSGEYRKAGRVTLDVQDLAPSLGPATKAAEWEPPSEMTAIDFTEAEEQTRVLMQGPQRDWARDRIRESIVFKAELTEEDVPLEAWQAAELGTALYEKGVIDSLQPHASDDLVAWVRARLAAEPELPLPDLLEQGILHGMGELADECADLLGTLGHSQGKAGQSPELVISLPVWHEEQHPGIGEVTFDGHRCVMLDFGEDIPVDEELGHLFGNYEEVERKQCVTRFLAAGILRRNACRRPTMDEVSELALEFRKAQVRSAQDVLACIGHAEERVAPVEAEIREALHDLVTPHHCKDFRFVSIVPMEELHDCRLVVLRADYRKRLVVETVTGTTGAQWHMFGLIDSAHILLLDPPADFDPEAWLASREETQPVLDTPALGWEYFFSQRNAYPTTVPGTVCCKACRGKRSDGARCGGSVLKAVALGSACEKPQTWTTPGTGKFKEIGAGVAGMSKAAKKAGFLVLTPVELWDDPVGRTGYRADHDLMRLEVRRRHLQEAASPVGEDVGWIAMPCTSHCDWEIHNGGTRTVASPEGGEGGAPLSEKEVVGNELGKFAALYFQTMMDAGKFPLAESSAPSGRYPKTWDLPAWKKVLRRPDVEIMIVKMCAYKLGPPDEPGKFYQHRTQIVARRFPGFFDLWVKFCPGLSISHQHVALKGARRGQQVSRCAEAGAYAADFCHKIMQATAKVVLDGVEHHTSPSRGLGKAGEAEPQQGPREDTREDTKIRNDEASCTQVDDQGPGVSQFGWPFSSGLCTHCGTGCSNACGPPPVAVNSWSPSTSWKAGYRGAAAFTESKGTCEGSAYVAESEAAAVAAKDYYDAVDAATIGTPEDWSAVLTAGRSLWTHTSSAAEAAKALWQVREDRGQQNLAGVDAPVFDQVLHPAMLRYLRDVRQFGMPVRYQGTRSRQSSPPHPRALANFAQLVAQIWKDVKKGRALLVPTSVIQGQAVFSCPLDLAEKMAPDRTIMEERRLIHDQRAVNLGSHKTIHPPANQPTHAQIARAVEWHRARNPGVHILISKKDAAGAFRLLWLDPNDVELFAADFPWTPACMLGDQPGPDRLATIVKSLELEAGVTALYLVSSFGFAGSPGEWKVWGAAAEFHHRAHRPQFGKRDGATPFESRALVDDAVLVEPLLGLRPWISAACYEAGAKLLLGQHVINKEKDALEGSFQTSKTVWGLEFDTAVQARTGQGECRIPDVRIQKGATLLADSVLDPGCRAVTHRTIQVVRGTAGSWTAVVKGLRNELRAADRMMGGSDPSGPARPSKIRGGDGRPREATKEEGDRAWQDWWQLVESLRWITSRPQTWSTKFQGGIRELLPVRERMALPGGMQMIHFVSSDATLQWIGAVDWTAGQACRVSIAGLLQTLLEVWAGHFDEAEWQWIHVGEMLSYLAFAAHRAPHWTGGMVLYGGDNQVVQGWIRHRTASTRAGRFLIRVLNALEMRYRFETCEPAWFRTNHNVVPDFITRCSEQEYQKLLKDKGWTDVKIEGSFKQALLDAERFGTPTLMFWEQEDRQLALQLRELSAARSLHRTLSPWSSWGVVECEFLSGKQEKLGDWGMAALAAGAGLTTCGANDAAQALLGDPVVAAARRQLVVASLGSDRQFRELGFVLAQAKTSRAEAVLLDGPNCTD